MPIELMLQTYQMLREIALLPPAQAVVAAVAVTVPGVPAVPMCARIMTRAVLQVAFIAPELPLIILIARHTVHFVFVEGIPMRK